MKVKISGYPTNWLRCQIHDRYMDKKYGFDWPDPDDWSKFEQFMGKLESAIQSLYNVTINKIIYHRKRKIYVRIDRSDTWSMDNTLAHIILPMLKQLRDTKHGAPFVDDEDVPEHLRSTAAAPKENEWDTDDNHFKRWNWVLDEMIYAFECEVDNDWDDQFHSGVSDLQWLKNDDGKFYKMERGPNDTHKFDKEGHDKAWARRNNSMRLFGKYYHNLWD
jgi:hypothetical protein